MESLKRIGIFALLAAGLLAITSSPQSPIDGTLDLGFAPGHVALIGVILLVVPTLAEQFGAMAKAGKCKRCGRSAAVGSALCHAHKRELAAVSQSVMVTRRSG